jgi:hypothetical protein
MWSFKRNVLKTEENPGCAMTLVDDVAFFDHGRNAPINVLANDGLMINPIVTIVSGPTYGTAFVNVNGAIEYDNTGFTNTTDTIVYHVANGECTATATLYLYLIGSPPTSLGFNINTSHPTSTSRCAGSALPNNYDTILYYDPSLGPITANVTRLYTNQSLTIPFRTLGSFANPVPQPKWFHRNAYTSYKMSNTDHGLVIAIDNSCSIE